MVDTCILCWWLYIVFRRCNMVRRQTSIRLSSTLHCTPRQFKMVFQSSIHSHTRSPAVYRLWFYRFCSHQTFAGKWYTEQRQSLEFCPPAWVAVDVLHKCASLTSAQVCPLTSEARRRGWPCPALPSGPVTGLWLSESWQMAKGGEAVDLRWSPGLRAFTSSDTEYPSSWPHRGPLQKLPFTDTVVHGKWLVDPNHLGGGERVRVNVDVWSQNLTSFLFFAFIIFLTLTVVWWAGLRWSSLLLPLLLLFSSSLTSNSQWLGRITQWLKLGMHWYRYQNWVSVPILGLSTVLILISISQRRLYMYKCDNFVHIFA